MNYSPIVIVGGDPNSIFFEIFFKSLKRKIKSPIILVASRSLLKLELKKYNVNKKINILDKENLNLKLLNNNNLNLIDVKFKDFKQYRKISKNINKYIFNCFEIAFELIKKYKIKKFINGPINKNHLLKKKFLGITEYISSKFNIKKNAMLIYNKKLSVCPVTTHLPIKYVQKKISKNLVIEKIKLIDEFYLSNFNRKPKIAVVGMNPHCESIDRFNEDEKITKPIVNLLNKKNFLIEGPFAADTAFLSQNRKKYDVILGMYHDQVLTPIKTLFEYDAINITLGLPFIRISPDHGPNEKMVGKNISNPLSLMRAISFLDTKID